MRNEKKKKSRTRPSTRRYWDIADGTCLAVSLWYAKARASIFC